ncbi:hypothetical protein F511_26232 [Dorcoceras hygrometricum]|uniref:Uncharacterized protein n=1 Tax=Dorcoceras hygrometricum TaxID=472368 RepID=A0A2Z7BR43_9LAMI|nr:hypothetical protein F511_26232 [Dorcoceras hygrometricum]
MLYHRNLNPGHAYHPSGSPEFLSYNPVLAISGSLKGSMFATIYDIFLFTDLPIIGPDSPYLIDDSSAPQLTAIIIASLLIKLL